MKTCTPGRPALVAVEAEPGERLVEGPRRKPTSRPVPGVEGGRPSVHRGRFSSLGRRSAACPPAAADRPRGTDCPRLAETRAELVAPFEIIGGRARDLVLQDALHRVEEPGTTSARHGLCVARSPNAMDEAVEEQEHRQRRRVRHDHDAARERVGVRPSQHRVRRVGNGGDRDRRGERRVEVLRHLTRAERDLPLDLARERLALDGSSPPRAPRAPPPPTTSSPPAGARPSGSSSPNSTTLPFTRRSVTSIPGGSSARCSRRDVLAGAALRAIRRRGPSRAGGPRSQDSALPLAPFVLAQWRVDSSTRRAPANSERRCSARASRAADASASRRSSAACTSSRASRRSAEPVSGTRDARRARIASAPATVPSARPMSAYPRLVMSSLSVAGSLSFSSNVPRGSDTTTDERATMLGGW